MDDIVYLRSIIAIQNPCSNRSSRWLRLIQLCPRHSSARDGLMKQAAKKGHDFTETLTTLEKNNPDELLEHVKNFSDTYLNSKQENHECIVYCAYNQILSGSGSYPSVWTMAYMVSYHKLWLCSKQLITLRTTELDICLTLTLVFLYRRFAITNKISGVFSPNSLLLGFSILS